MGSASLLRFLQGRPPGQHRRLAWRAGGIRANPHPARRGTLDTSYRLLASAWPGPRGWAPDPGAAGGGLRRHPDADDRSSAHAPRGGPRLPRRSMEPARAVRAAGQLFLAALDLDPGRRAGRPPGRRDPDGPPPPGAATAPAGRRARANARLRLPPTAGLGLT